jgi:hypothetical protein
MGIINTLFGASFVILGFTGFLMFTEMPKEDAVVTSVSLKQLDADSVQCEIGFKDEGKPEAISISPKSYCDDYAVGDKVLIKSGKIFQYNTDDDDDFSF